MDSREERDRAEVCLSQCTWSPWLEVDGATILWNDSVRDFQRGRAGHIVEALEQPLLLLKDMEVYRRFKQKYLFLSLKSDLAMVSNVSYPRIWILSYTFALFVHVILPFFLYRLLNKFLWLRNGSTTPVKRLTLRPSPVPMLRSPWGPSNKNK